MEIQKYSKDQHQLVVHKTLWHVNDHTYLLEDQIHCTAFEDDPWAAKCHTQNENTEPL